MSRSQMRESIYPTVSYDFLSSLEDCVTTTRECTVSLGLGLEKLDKGTGNLPRLGRVLNNRHHFLVLPQPTISAHLSSASSSMAPQIETLISKAERRIKAQWDTISNMEQRLEILSSNPLPDLSSSSAVPTLDGDGLSTGGPAAGLEQLELKDLNPAQRRHVVVLKNKRKRLEEERRKLERAES